MDSASIPETVLPVSSCDRAVPCSPAVASRRTAPRVAVVGRAVNMPWSCATPFCCMAKAGRYGDWGRLEIDRWRVSWRHRMDAWTPAVSRDPTLTQGLLMDAEERPSAVSDNSADRLGTIAYRVADRVRSARPTDVDSPKR